MQDMDYEDMAEARAERHGDFSGFAGSCPKSYWRGVHGYEAKRQRQLDQKRQAIKACFPTLADVWPSK